MTHQTSTMGLMRTSMDPLRHNTLPPSILSLTTFSKRMDILGNFVIKQAPGNPLYPFDSGIVVWMPSRGLRTCHRFAVIPAGAVNTLTVAQAVAIGTYLPLTCEGFTLTYALELPLPVNNNVQSDGITISPPSYNDVFSQARIYAGTLTVISDTVPIGATSLSGYLAGTSVCDIRDIFWGGQFRREAFSPSLMVQSATTLKDAIKETGIGRGVTTVVGPDISPYFTAPDSQRQMDYRGSMQADVISLTGTTNTPSALGSNNSAALWGGFVSPWGVSNTTPPLTIATKFALMNVVWPTDNVFQNATGDTGRPLDQINPIGGCYEVSVDFTLAYNASIVPAGYGERVDVHFRSVFASVSEGAIFYEHVVETQTVFCTMGSLGYTEAAAGYFPFAPRCHATHNPKRFMAADFGTYTRPQNNDVSSCRSQQRVGGMYIGTEVYVMTCNASLVNASPTCLHYTIDASLKPTITATAVNDYSFGGGELGPVRAIRWDGVADGQVIRVDGTFLVEGVAGALVAPFVQSGGGMTNSCENINALNFLAFLYNSVDTPFRRVWQTEEYSRFCRRDLTNVTTRQIRSYGNARLIHAAAAAGVLTELTAEEHEAVEGTRVSAKAGSVIALTQANDLHEKRAREEERHLVDDPYMNSRFIGAGTSVGDRLRNLDSVMEPMKRIRDAFVAARSEFHPKGLHRTRE